MLIIISIIGYLMGTIPGAFILVKLVSGKDIRDIGTGNVGAMNSYDVTNKKWIGIAVFFIDLLKGILAVCIAKFISHNDITAVYLAGFFSVLGHNFNIFLKLKGGRGLATGAGVFIMINPIIVVIWGLMYIAGNYIIKKNVHVGSVIATICTPLMIFYTPEKLLQKSAFISGITITNLLIFSSSVCIVILIKHIKPIIDLFKETSEYKRLKG